MQKKILLQIFLLVIILTISAMFYKTYFVNINIEKNITEKRENNLMVTAILLHQKREN